MTKPSAETNEPEPPLLNRTLERCTCSNHSLVGLKSYLSCSSLAGGLLNSHIPSSAEVLPSRTRLTKTKAAIRERQIFFMKAPHLGWAGSPAFGDGLCGSTADVVAFRSRQFD